MELGLNKLPWYAQIGAFAGVAIALFVVFRVYYVGPQREMQAQRQTALAERQSALDQARRDAAELAEFETEVGDLNLRLEALSAVLPEQQEVSELLRRLNTFAVQANLTMRAFRPQAAVTEEMHSEWPIQLQIDGTFHNLGMFFDRISKFSRIINISDVVIQAKEPPELNSTITVECTASTFVLLDPPEVAADPAAPPA
jgi:type IV pilus assembly protein PilO